MPDKHLISWTVSHPRLVPTLVFVSMLVTVIAFTVAATRIVTRADSNAEAHTALCVLRADLEKRISDGRQFLRDHPNGIPGITAKTISTSIGNQQATLDALSSSLHCKNP